MNGIDFAILGVLGLSILMGVMRGFTREILGFMTWAFSAAATYLLIPPFSGIARSYIANPMIADTITGIIIFIIVLIFFSLLTNFISGAVRSSTLGGIDRSLGLLVGFLRALILLSLAEVIFSAFTPRPNQPPSIQNARFTPLVRQGGDVLMGMIPLNWQNSLKTMVSKTMDGKGLDKKEPQDTTQNHSNQPVQQKSSQGGLNGNSLSDAFLSFGKIVPHEDVSPAPAAQTVHPSSPEDSQKTAESLAQLRPQAVETGRDDYADSERRDMNRLFQTNQ